MIEYIEGNIFESPAQVIVNTVNTVGVMGKGLALSFKQRYPDMFNRYKIACEKHQLTIGKLMLFYEEDHWLLMFPTKENWRNPSKIEYIEKGLMKFVSTYADKNITSIAFPRLGCGNGELDWNEVKPLMERYLKKLPIDIYIYIGGNRQTTPEHKEQKNTIAWLRANAKDMSFEGVKDDFQTLSTILPYSFSYNNHNYEMSMHKSLNITDITGHVSYTFDEEEFYKLWDDIRVQCVFSIVNASEKTKALYALLNHVGYLSQIRILDSKSQCLEDGYQINAGLGRVIPMREE